MITICEYNDGRCADYRPQEFVDRFLSICAEHRDQKRAMLFAFLIYDFLNPQVIKVLKDHDYWTSLDILAGSFVSVFAFHSPTDNSASSSTTRLPQFNAPVITILNQHFGISNATMPTLLFFQVADEAIAGQQIVKLRATTVETAFEEINSILKDAISAVSDVTPENFGNAEAIFTLVSQQLSQRHTIVQLQKVAKQLKSVASIAKWLA